MGEAELIYLHAELICLRAELIVQLA